MSLFPSASARVRRHGGRRVAALMLAVVLAALGSALLLPISAYAGDFSVPRVDIRAQVMDNGDLFVVEERVFSFEDDVNGVYWDIPFAQNEQGNTSEVTVLSVHSRAGSAGDGGAAPSDAAALREVASASPGDAGVYTVERNSDSMLLKVFAPSADGDETTLWVAYMLEGAVMAWPDTAELYWQFIGAGWEEDASDVELRVWFPTADHGTAPLTAGASANFRAWGHGPLDGVVELDVDDPARPGVTLTAPVVHGGQFAEVRVAFPADWVPGLTQEGGPRLNTMLAQEEAWAAEANDQRRRARIIAAGGTIVFTAAPLCLLVCSAWLRKTKYSSPKSLFDEPYFRDLPSNDHPAVLSALVYDGSVQDCAFVATLMKLTDDRVIAIGHSTRTEEGFLGFGEKTVEEYSLELRVLERVDDPIDRAAIELYFGPEPRNGDEVCFGSLSADEKVGERLQAFTDEVRAGLEKRGLVSTVPVEFKVAVGTAGIILGCLAICFIIYTDGVNLPFILAGVAMDVAAAVIAATAKRYSPATVAILSRCRALRCWLEDFTNLDEAVPDDLILWNKMLVMGVALGVSEEVLRRLADAVPRQLREDEGGVYHYPSYWWYYHHGSMGSPMGELNREYRATVTELSSSSDSSGTGGGGGFSGGGGGGVGGGGGGSF